MLIALRHLPMPFADGYAAMPATPIRLALCRRHDASLIDSADCFWLLRYATLLYAYFAPLPLIGDVTLPLSRWPLRYARAHSAIRLICCRAPLHHLSLLDIDILHRLFHAIRHLRQPDILPRRHAPCRLYAYAYASALTLLAALRRRCF